MGHRRQGYDEAIDRHREEHQRDTRDQRRFWIGVMLRCWFWAAIGLVLGAYAFHTTDEQIGHISLYAGQIVTFVGVLGTLGWAMIEAEKRGWR